MLDDSNMHKGHRQKVRERYYKTGMDSMPDHNILEMLLFFGIPVKDTNEIAHQLIERFGSFAGVLQADVASLRSVKGMTESAACLISMILPIYKRYCEDKNRRIVSFSGVEDIVNFLRPKFLDSPNEKVFALYLDNTMRLICAKQLNEGDASSSSLDMRLLVRTALDTNSCHVILAHNHLNSISTPSPEDVETTIKVKESLKTLGIDLVDHLIVSENGFCSMANMSRFSNIF